MSHQDAQKAEADAATKKASSTRVLLLLWLGVLLGPVSWAAQLQCVYALSEQACKGNVSLLSLHLTTALCLAGAIAGGAIAFVHWRRLGSRWPADADGPGPGRGHWMSV